MQPRKILIMISQLIIAHKCKKMVQPKMFRKFWITNISLLVKVFNNKIKLFNFLMEKLIKLHKISFNNNNSNKMMIFGIPIYNKIIIQIFRANHIRVKFLIILFNKIITWVKNNSHNVKIFFIMIKTFFYFI